MQKRLPYVTAVSGAAAGAVPAQSAVIAPAATRNFAQPAHWGDHRGWGGRRRWEPGWETGSW
ncbi:hypothetical protein AB4305_15915 [Nocardia sp. 2YAB30]|uniref:hypothetical protein n=1 Tax=unclassified Nocardia TaxID=2637762 RepID=UPI003F9A0A51